MSDESSNVEVSPSVWSIIWIGLIFYALFRIGDRLGEIVALMGATK